MTITEYIKKNGKYSILEKPFNCVDSLILAQLSYLKFEGMIDHFDNNPDGIILKDLLNSEKKSNLFTDERYAHLNEPLFNAACKSIRFGSMILNNFVNIIDKERTIQFSAVTMQLDAGINCVVFRGTDDNIIGWKEDLDMTYEEVIPAQAEAVKYLEKAASYLDGSLYISGHSKGGNLAVYSSMMVNDDIKSRIVKIYSHDGPGFMPEILKSSNFFSIKDKITKLVPKSSLVGLLLTTGEKYEVIECHKLGAMQHSPFTWIVDGFDFKRAENIDTYAKLHERALSIWTENMTFEQFKYLSDEAYKIITDAGINNLNDFGDDFFGSIQSLIQAAGNLDEVSKEKMKEIFMVFKEAAKLAAYENARDDLDIALESISQVSKKVKDRQNDIKNSVKIRTQKNKNARIKKTSKNKK